MTRIWLIQAKGSLYQERAIVFEFGSGVSAKSSVLDNNDPLIAKPRACKRDGNEQFKAEGFSKAYNMYVKAIEACCGMAGEELLKLNAKFDEQHQELASKRYRKFSGGVKKIQQSLRKGGQETVGSSRDQKVCGTSTFI